MISRVLPSVVQVIDWHAMQFYNLVLFISSVAVFSLVAQRMGGTKSGK